MHVIRTLLLLCLLACSATPEGAYDPFLADPGKADGSGFFDAEGWTLALDGDRLEVEGSAGDASYRDVERRPWPGDAVRIRLDGGDRLAGMRSFVLVAGDVEERLRAARVLRAAGLVVPRAVAVELVVDGVEVGERVLFEHVGDRFLETHFGDDDDDDIERSADEALALVLARASDAHDPLSGRELAAAFDLEAVGRAAAAIEALAGSNAPPDFAFVRGCEDACRVPVPEFGTQVVQNTALVAALRHPEVRAAYAAALPRLALCLHDPSCGDDDAAAARVLAEDEARRALDAPDGYADYPSFVAMDGGIAVAFRSLDAAAAEVTFVARGSLPLSYDRARDLWVGVADATVLGRGDYHFDVTGSNGVLTRVSDPTRPSAVDADAIDVLREVARVRLPVGEPSGLASHDGRLFVVGDESDDVYVVDPLTGDVLEQIDVDIRGLEGLAIDSFTRVLYVADEDSGKVHSFGLDGEPLDRFVVRWAEDDEDGGIEGLTVDIRTGHLFLAKERAPMRIAEFDSQGEQLGRRRIEGPSDLSALAIDPRDGLLYALSDEDQSLLRLDADWNVESSWPLDIEKPEGLVVDGGRVYVVSDAQHELTTFELGR